jgi:nucleoside-diphosphate-sugar epimerase
MRALVTGAAGFVGSNVSRRLLRDGHEVHAVSHARGDNWRLTGLDDLIVHEADLTAPGVARALVEHVAPDWILHLAAYGAYSWQTDVTRICATNLVTTIELVDAAERGKVQAFIHAGSSSEYGFKDHAPDEEERPDPNSAYAVAKAAATMYCRHRALAAGLPTITLRLYSVYGRLEDDRRLIPTLLRHALRGTLPPLVAPETSRDFVYVEDVCEAFVRAAERSSALSGGIYNVGSGRQMSLSELVDCVRALLDVEAEPSWGSYPARDWDTNVWRAKTNLAAYELGWSACTDIEDGLRRTAAWLGEDIAIDEASESAHPPESQWSGRVSAGDLRETVTARS